MGYLKMKQLLRYSLFIGFILAFSLQLNAQDTLRVMHYNLLYYDVVTGFCNNNNNGTPAKNAALRTLIAHTSPDILTVNEISKEVSAHELLLDSVLNFVFPGRYARAGFSNVNGSDIVNEMYYDVQKVWLEDALGIYSDVRDADAYRVGILPPGGFGDTARLLLTVTHLKAGSSGSDEQKRAGMVSDILNWLSNQGFTGNNLLLGDLNLKTSQETAWYNLTQFPNAAVRFYDPVATPGNWYNDLQFAHLHSQSTHNTQGGCAASGGMDDRFDFILTSKAVLDGSLGVQYANGSYRAVGQDGLRFNGNIYDPGNQAVPQEVALALHTISDHLPIMMGLLYGPGTGMAEKPEPRIWTESLNQNQVTIRSNIPMDAYRLRVFSSDGRWQGSTVIPSGQTAFQLPFSLPSGFYLFELQEEGGMGRALKVVVFGKP